VNDSDFNKQLSKLRNFMDTQGRLTQWPASRKMQIIAIEYLASHFDKGETYTEKQLNDLLNTLHTFADPALLRRELFEAGHFNRHGDGSSYWRTPQTKLL